MPRPVQPRGPRILVGGGGEQRTLKIAAKHADMTHWFPLGFDVLRHKTEVLERHCAEIGRDPSTIERTMAAPVLVVGNDAERRAALERIPDGASTVCQRRAARTDGRRASAVPRRGIHRLHVQQLDLSDAGGDQPGRRVAPARRRRDGGHRLTS